MFGSLNKNLSLLNQKLILAIVVIVSVSIASEVFAKQPNPYRVDPKTITLIHAGTLLAVPGKAPKRRQTVVIRNGKIDSILSGYASKSQAGFDGHEVVVIDLSDHFVMPGFIDLHAHIAVEYGDQIKLKTVTMSDADHALTAAMYAERTLQAGFTTIRDLGSRGDAVFALRDAIKAGKVPGPKILVAGDAIAATGGHGDVHGFRQEILDAIPSTAICDGADSCRAAVRRQVKRGADVIKVTTTGGVLSETATGIGQQLTDEELRAIVETAHGLGRKVTAHAHGKGGIEAALRAGFDSIEHSTWADEETMKLYIKHDAWLIPTIYIITAIGDTPEKVKKGPFAHLPPSSMAKLLNIGRQPKIMGALAYKMGVKIAMGTDAGVYSHGENANEFLEYKNLGMSEMEALVSGTIDAAEATGIKNQTGSLEAGKAADIVAMPNNPLKDIKAVLKVTFVMRDGIVFKQ